MTKSQRARPGAHRHRAPLRAPGLRRDRIAEASGPLAAALGAHRGPGPVERLAPAPAGRWLALRRHRYCARKIDAAMALDTGPPGSLHLVAQLLDLDAVAEIRACAARHAEFDFTPAAIFARTAQKRLPASGTAVHARTHAYPGALARALVDGRFKAIDAVASFRGEGG